MSEENNEMVNLGDLGSASSADIRKALQGQPSPVEDKEATEPTTPQPTEVAKERGTKLGDFENSLIANEDGSFKLVNPYSTNLDVDLDQFETRRRRVSEGSMLSGILNGVEGLEQNFTYTGLESTAKRSEEAQGVVNKMKNGMTQLVADTAINVGQGFASLLYGVPSAIVNGDLTKLYDNAVANTMDRGTEFLDEFYEIKRGGDQSGLQKTANFLFDDLAGGASFVMGAIATEMAFTAISVATFGGAVPAQVAASAGIVARGTRLVQKALQGGKALMAGRLVDDALRGARALGQQATRQAATSALRTAAEAARNPMAMQAAARVGRQLITGASMESGMEARHMLNAAVETQKQQHEQLFGEGTFTDEMGAAFRDEISGYADGVFGVNMALVGASNMLMFPKLFGVGMRRGMRTSKFIDTSTLSSKARARLAKNLGVTEGNLPKLVDAARGNTWGRIAGRGGTTGRVTAANLKNAAYEGFIEEGGQGAISRTTEDYIAKRYDPKNVEKTANFTESFLEGLKGSYTTKDGFKEIGIGMLLAFTGVPMYARAKNADGSAKWQWQMMGGYADQRKELLARDAKANAIIELSEKNGDVGGILRAEVANFHRQNGLQRDQDVAIAEGRFKEAKDIESEMIFSHAAAKVVTGRYDQSIAEAEQIMEEMSADEFREQYGDAGKNMTDAEVEQRKAQVLEKHKQRMQAAREAYDMAGEIYRGEDPDIHTGVAHMVYMAQEKDLREKAIAEEMAEAIEGMNADQILDLVRAQEDLNLTDEHLGEILKRINRNKDIEKQLKTKLERKIIKNVDPTKAEQRNKEVEDLQREQEENLNYMQNLMDAMATAQNVDRNKYDFSDESFLADLAQLHAFISLQNENVAFQKADLEQLQADLRAVAADRKVLIANYNDFISPGGVQRFEERMIGSIEALAKMSAEERQEEKQDAAQEETVEELREEQKTPVADPEQEESDVPDGPPGATPAPEVVDPQGAPEVNPETGNFGFPDPTPPPTAVPDDAPGAEGTTETPDGVPEGMGLGDEGGTGQPNEPTPTPQQPAQPEVGQLRLVLINARHPDNNMGLDANAMALRKVLAGIPAGTKLTLRLNENESGVDVLTPDGVRIDTIRNAPGSKRLDRLSPAVKNLILTNGEVTVVTTTALDASAPGLEGGMAFLGGEKVVSIDPTTGKAIPENPNLDRTIEGVLGESFDKVVTGFGVMNLEGEILAMQDPDIPFLTVHPAGDIRFAGNAYISTVDANGVAAYHSVQLAPFGEGRATQILDVIDAYNQFVTNPSEMTAAQKMAFTTWATVNGIDYKTLKGKELRRAVQRPLRRLISSDLASAQREKVDKLIARGRFSRPYFSVEVTGKGQHTLTIVTQQAQGKKPLRQFSHNKEGVRNPQTLIRENLAAHRMNVTKEALEQQLPNGDGTYTAMSPRDMIKEHGSFGDRMPFFIDGKMYNRVPVSIGIALEALTPVPTNRTSQGGRVVGDNAALLAQKKGELKQAQAQLDANRELLKEELDKPHGTKLDEPLVKFYQKEVARLEAVVDTLENEIADLESPDNPPPTPTKTDDLFVDGSGIEGIDWDNFDIPGGMSTSALLDDAYLDSLSDQEYYRLMGEDTRRGEMSLSALIDEDHMKRAGALYNVPGLNSRQLRDGINFSRGVMARAFVTHIRTVDRRKPVKADYLRRTVRATLENQLKGLEQAPKHPAVNAAIEAHKAYLSPKVFNRLMDLAMVELLREATGVIQLRGAGSLESALQKLGQTQQDRVNEENENAAELSENPMAAFDDNFAFGVDPGSTLRLEAKLMLMSLIDKQNNNADAVGLAGRRFIDVKGLMGKLNAVLAGTEPSFEAVTARLEDWVGTYPEFRAVLDAMSMEKAIENLPPNKRGDTNAIKQSMAIQDMIRNQFVNYAVKEATTFDSVKIIRQQVDIDNPMGGVAADIQIWNSNSRNMKDHVRSDMRSILVQHGFFDIQGNLVPEKFTGLRKKIDDIADLPTADQAQALRDVLHRELGIVVPVTALTEANQTKDRKGNRFFKNIAKVLGKKTMLGGGLGRFKEALTTISKSDMTLDDLLATKKKDGRTANREGQNMVDFFVALADYRPNFIQNSSKDGDNKTRWHYSAPKLLHQMLRTIKGTPQDHLMGGRIGMLQAEDQDLVGITYLSGIKLENRGKERDFHKMEAGDRVVAQLAMYGNKRLYRYEDRGEDKVMISKFLMPTLADKQTMPILQAPAMSAKQAGIKLQEGLDKKPWRQVQITDVVQSVKGVYDASAVKKSIDLEVDRIMRIQAADFKGMTAAQRQAVGFVTAPALNRLAENFIEGKISRKEFRDMVHREAVQEYEAALTADLQHMLEQSQGTIWREASDESGTIGRLEHFNVGKAKYAFVKDHVGPNADFEIGGMDKVAFLAYVGKYAIDSMDARTSIINDTMGDLGAFVKVDKEGKVRVAKTATNLGKRFAALIAPGNAIPYVQYRNAKGEVVNNHSVSFLVMPARVVDKASHYTYLERLGQTPDELAMQEGYDSADAAEYTTVEEHLSILYAEGKITRREMAGLLGKITRGEKLDNAELGWFQPMKPVTTARVGDHMLYVKSASFPLVPQLTQGTELDKLRVFLEENNIQRAAYDSAVKLGNEWSDVNDTNATDEQKMVPIHDGANVVIDAEALGQRVIRGVDRKYMRIQQQVPVGKAKEKIHGSQVAKLFLVDLADAKFELDGQKMTGREMYKEYIEARDTELTYRLQAFADKYGLAIENGKVYHTPESRKKFAARIVEEGVARGYDANELAHLHFDPATGRFTTPLEGGPSQERVENLIKAILFKEVYEPSIEGFSGPIRPEVGIKTLDANEVDKSDIMWVKKDGKKVFNGKKLKVAKGKQMDQIIMPWKYKASLEKYMDEDGNIDADSLPPELLKVFAYRIPGQRKSSSVAFEIVGFLPEQYGDTLIVNEELVGRIGQDYDIDKMFGFLYSIKQDDNGDITVTRSGDTNQDKISAARNRQVDIYIASMTSQDKAVQRAIHAPVTDGYGEQLGDQISLLRNPETAVGMPMSMSYNAGKADAARSAKASIGVMATHNVLHSQLEQALSMSKDAIPYLVDEAGDTIGFVEILSKRSDKPSERIESSKFVGAGEIHDDTFLLTYTQDGKEYTPKAGNKSDQFSRLLNHAVDNENNGLLDKLGITADTWPIWTGLTHMGYNQETIAIFVAMPGIQKYLEMKSKSRRLGDETRIEISDAMFAVADGILSDEDFQKIQVNLNKEDMLAIVQGRSDLSEKQQAMMNFQALSALQTLEGLGRDLRNVQTHMKMDTNRPKSVVAVQVAIAEMKQSAKKAGKADESISVQAALRASQNTVAGTVSSLIESTFSQLADVDGNLLPQSVINELVADLKRAGNPGDIAEQVTTLVKGAKSLRYAAFTEKFAGKTAQEVREEAHSVETGGIAKRLMEMRSAHPELLDNAFLRQLIAVNHPGSYPHVEFPGDRQLEANPIEIQRAFLDLLRSSDPEIRAFAKDLVSYALATSGGRLKSRGFLKYVPAEYLQANGLQEFVTSDQISGHLENRVNLQEIIRHNPDLAPNYKKGSPESRGAFKMHQGTMLVRMASPNFRGFVRISGKLYVPAGAPIELTTDGFTERFYPLERKPVTELGDYLMDEYTTGALPLDQKRPARIPARDSMPFDATMTTGPHVHNEASGEVNHNVPDMAFPEPPTEVPTGIPDGMGLGGNNEFSPDGIPPGMGLGEKNEAPKKGVHDKIARNPSLESKGPNDFKTFLEKGTLRTNAFLQTLADAQNTLPADKRLKVKIVDSMNTRGLYDPNNHTMYIRKDSVNNSRVVTHEAMHAVTQLGIEIAEGNLKISDKAMEKKLKDAVKEIRGLFAVAMSEENLKLMGLKHSEVMRARRGWKAFEKSQRGESLTEEQQADYKWLTQNVDKYYGTINLKEFIAEAFSNKDFAERLAKISANRPKTFVQRLMDAVTKALKAIGINMGRDSQFVQEIYLATMGLADLQTRGGIGVDTRASAPVSALMDAVNEPDLGGFGVQGLQELKDYKQKRIRQFEELKSRYKDNREFVRRVEARLVQERKELAVMTDDSVKVTPDYLLAVGQRELDFARRTIESVDATDPEIDMALSALENIYSVVEFYDQAREIMSDPTLKEVATELRREASELRDNYLEKARTILREDALRQFAGTGVNVDADTFEALQERGFLSSRFMDASRQGTTELAFLDKIVRDASQKQRAEFNNRARRYMDKSNEMKKGAYFKKHGWNGFVELDADGNPTPNMISMLSGRYESENRQKYAELGNTKAFYDWRNSVTERINIDAIFDYSGDVVKRKKNPKYVAYLEKKFGKAGAQEFLRRQEVMLQEYIDNRQSEFDILELTDKDPETAKQDWVNKNDPMLAYRRADGKAKGVKGSTSRFLLNMPLRVVKGQSTGYYDARFEEMMEDPAALEFYNEYRQQMREMVGMLPAHKLKRDVHLAKAGLFIPAISRSLTNDLLSRNGFLDAVGRLPDSIKASMTIDPEFDVNKLIDPVTGRPRQELPTYFLGQVDPETQEYDMDRTFLAFTMMATTYDSKNAIEDKVRMTRSVMSNARVVSGKKSLAERALNRMGFEAAPGYRDAASRETTMKLVDTVVDTFYGYRTAKDPTMDAPRSMWTKKQLAEIERLEDELELAEDQEKKDAIEKQIAEKTPKLSAGKAVTGVQQFVQAKGMAWNIPAAIVNMIFGSLSVFKHSAGRSDFSEADARKATGLMLHSSLNNMTLNTGATQTGTALKIQNAMINLDVLKDFTEMRYDVRKFVKQAGESGVNQAVRQGFNKLRMYEIQRSSEYFVYGQGTIALLLSEKIDGVSLWELMGEDGVIDIDGWRPGEPNFIKLMNKVDQVNKRIHGNYDPNSPIAIKKTLLGRLLMQFRSWLPEAVATRFEQEKYDPYLDRAVKGTYITMFSKEWRQNWTAMMPMLLPAWARTKNMDTMKEEISAVDQENIRKFGASFRHYLQVMVLIQLLRALKDDEDDEQSLRMLNFGLNLMDRVENDLALFGRPGAFLDMTQGDFLAVIGAMSDAEKLMEATVLTVQGDAYIETGVYAGTPRMWHYTKKLTPHLGAVQRVVNNLDRELGS